MLYLKCEYCLCSGIAQGTVCGVCGGTGYHRSYFDNKDTLRRWSVLRMLDLVYPEYKFRDRTQRLMDLYHIVPFAEEPQMTPAAAELLQEQLASLMSLGTAELPEIIAGAEKK